MRKRRDRHTVIDASKLAQGSQDIEVEASEGNISKSDWVWHQVEELILSE